jgi:hypothetical protein
MTLTSKQRRLEDQLKLRFMKTAKPKERRTTQYELVEQARRTIETSARLVEQHVAGVQRLEMYIDLRRQRQLRDALK